MSEQRIQTIKIVWKGDDAKVQAVSFTRAVQGTDKAIDQLNTVLGKNATVTAKTVLTQAEHTRVAKRTTTQAIKMLNVHTKMTTQLKSQIKMTTMSADKQERYAAQMRLGQNATLGQRLEVARLTKALQLQRVASTQVQGSFRGLRGQAQNIGWQLQDIAVQAQMGTNALVILSQQGSQLASGFGPMGAWIGAGIAAAGALAGIAVKMITGKKTSKELAAAQELVNESFKTGAVDAAELTEKYRKLFAKNKELALLTARTASFAAADQAKAAKDSIKELSKEYFGLKDNIQTTGNETIAMQNAITLTNAKRTKQIAEASTKLGITVKQYKEIARLVSERKFNTSTSMIVGIATSTGIANRKLSIFAKKVAEADQVVEDSNKRRAKLLDITQDQKLKPFIDVKAREAEIKKAFESEYNSLLKATETIRQEYDRRKTIVDEYVKSVGLVTLKAAHQYHRLEEWKTEQFAEQSEKRLQIEINASKKIAAEKERALKRIEGRQAVTGTRVEVENRVFELNMDILHNQKREAEKKRNFSAISRINVLIEGETKRHAFALEQAKGQGKKPKTDAIERAFLREVNATIKQTETINEQYLRRKLIVDNYVNKVGSVNRMAAIQYKRIEEWKTGKFAEQSEKRLAIQVAASKKLASERERALQAIERGQTRSGSEGLIESNLFKKNTAELQAQKERALRMRNLSDLSRINGLMEGENKRHKVVMGQIAHAGLMAEYAASTTFLNGMMGIMGQLTQIAQDGSVEAKALFYATQAIAFATTIVNAEQASIAAGAREAQMTGIAGFFSSAAMVKAMGYASAGIIAGTTIAGAFDRGGKIPQDKYGVVSEYSDEIVDGVIVKGKKGGSRVTSSKDTAAILDSANQGGLVFNITQNFNIKGNGDKALARATAEAAEMGANKGYKRVADDFNTGRGIRQTLKKSIGA